ncbi:MAG: histidine--tRNA ligase [Planctomycetota bacterium]|nr:histidine--tRNA ligase [Planctomycetota bacterium]MDA1162404.1 histidine--tRNA ligase [Planctomycetota bacterium]
MIKPRTLKGFRDYLPNAMIAREQLIETAQRVYRSYGFSPIDTPALEYTEILLGKGSDETDKQLYRFTDHGDRDVALRFDLTIPLARFAAQYSQELGTPFKRYHIGKVWRGENTQKGRYREFIQCDFDTIGTLANAADVETLFVINDLMEQIGFERFNIRINNRLVLNGLLEKVGLTDKSVGVLRSLDKLPKIGRDKVIAEMVEFVGTTTEQAASVLDLAELTGEPTEILTSLEEMLAGSEAGQNGVARLRELFDCCAKIGLPEGRVGLDLSIARGLDYYTGTIYETFLGDLPTIGSVCSGGRYDNLAGLFTKQELPGIGASLGLDRLLAAMESMEMVESASTPAEVFIPQFDGAHLGDYLAIARTLRTAGLRVEVFPEAKGIGKQLKYADKKGHKIAVIAGEDEFAQGIWQVKNLQVRGDQADVATTDLAKYLTTLLDE